MYSPSLAWPVQYSDMSADPAQADPTMYCKGCWYVLDGLPENRCPECGRPFDPKRRRTYRKLACGYYLTGNESGVYPECGEKI